MKYQYFTENHHQNINQQVYPKTLQAPHLIMPEFDPGKLKDSEKQKIMPLLLPLPPEVQALWIKCPLPHHLLRFHGNSILIKLENSGPKLSK